MASSEIKILVVGNAPLANIPQGNYEVVFYFANNSHLISSIDADLVFGVIQNFTIDPIQWDCKRWGEIRREKYLKFENFFRNNFKSIVIGKINAINRKFKSDFNVVEEVTHKCIVNHVIWAVPIIRLIRVLGLKGCINYILLLVNLKSNINGKYRPSSGYFIALYAKRKYKYAHIDMVGFSNPNEAYTVTSEIVLDKSPHSKLDSLILNQLKKK